MDLKIEWYVAIHFCISLKKLSKETLEILQKAYKDKCLPQSTAYCSHKELWNGRESPVLRHSTGWLVTATTETMVNTVAAVVWEGWHLGVR